MGKTRKKTEALEQNPFEVPLYTSWDAARYLRVPLWSVAALSGRFREWLEPELFHHRFWHGRSPPDVFDDDLSPADFPETSQRITFASLARMFVRAGVLCILADGPRTESERTMWPEPHRTVIRWLEDTGHAPLSFGEGSAEEQVEQLVGSLVRRLDERRGALIRKHLAVRLTRVEVKDGRPTRIFPLSRSDDEDSPQIIVLDPLIRFGRPTLVRRGVPTDTLFERFRPAMRLQNWLRIQRSGGRDHEAIRFESGPFGPPIPFYGW